MAAAINISSVMEYRAHPAFTFFSNAMQFSEYFRSLFSIFLKDNNYGIILIGVDNHEFIFKRANNG